MKKFFSFSDVRLNYKSLILQALKYKKNPFLSQEIGKNKTIGLIFFNPSLRTRLSSIKAAHNLNAKIWILNANVDSWSLEIEEGVIMNSSKQEHIKDAIKVINNYCDIIGIRIFPELKNREIDYKEIIFNKILEYSSIPVVNLESCTLHPLQSFADLITVEEFNKNKKKIKVVLTWVPHVKALPQSVANSFCEWFSKIDYIELIITHPKGYELSSKFTKGVKILYDQNYALQNADFVYAKNWSSYQDYGKIITLDPSWIITMEKIKNIANNAKFMHCLPIRRNLLATDEVLDSPNSIIIEQSKNRIFSAQTIFNEMLS